MEELRSKEFDILLREENAPLLSGEASTSESFWDKKHFSVGYGTLSYEGEVIGEEEARERAKRGFIQAEIDATSLVPKKWKELSKERQGVLTRMIYQLGFHGTSEFKNTLAAIKKGDFSTAADEMLDSKWFKIDTPERAYRESEIMRGSLGSGKASLRSR